MSVIGYMALFLGGYIVGWLVTCFFVWLEDKL